MRRKKLVNRSRKGFTMVEFSIVMGAVAVLLITVALLISSIIAQYQKGLTLKAVNSVGRGLVNEFTETINGSPSVDADSLCSSHLSTMQQSCRNDGAYNFIFQQKTADYNFVGETQERVQVGGIFCTGKYSYIWNTYYGKGDDGDYKISLKYKLVGESSPRTLKNFRLVKVEDETYRVCSSQVGANYEAKFYESLNNKIEIDITTLANGSAKILNTPPEQGFLSAFDLDLELYELTIFPVSQDQITFRTFIPGTFVLASSRGNINITRSGDYCDIKNLSNDETASDLLHIGAEFNYCAINKFNFAARTAGL